MEDHFPVFVVYQLAYFAHLSKLFPLVLFYHLLEKGDLLQNVAQDRDVELGALVLLFPEYLEGVFDNGLAVALVFLINHIVMEIIFYYHPLGS